MQLLYDYTKENIGVDTEIFKRLEHAMEQQEKSQLKDDLHNISGHFTQAKGF